MPRILKLVLILFGLAYLISPVDLIPDLALPWLGWVDDGVIVWSIYYLIRYGELPWFLFKKKQGVPGQGSGPTPGRPRSNPGGSRNPGAAGPGKSGPSKTGSQDRARPKRASSKPPRSPYQILGVAPTASWAEIQAAHKEKIKQYHPDKLSHLGEEFSNLANEKFLEIQAAYDSLRKKHRG